MWMLRAALSFCQCFLWGLVYLDSPPHCVHFQLPISIYNLFLSTFVTKHNKIEGGELGCVRRGQGTLSVNFCSSASPRVIHKHSFPYAEPRVRALTQAPMLWGENIVQQWHRSNLGLTDWFHLGFCCLKVFDPEVRVGAVVNGSAAEWQPQKVKHFTANSGPPEAQA